MLLTTMRRTAGAIAACAAMTAAACTPHQPSSVPAATTTLSKPWQPTFTDNFDGTALDQSKWSALTTKNTGLSGTDCKVNSPNNVAVRGGQLWLSVRKEPRPIMCPNIDGSSYPTQYTSGGVTSSGKFSQTYGRFETRAAFPNAPSGLHGAIWMWPESNKARYGAGSGEIDTAEQWTGSSQYVPALHFRPLDGWTSPDGSTKRTPNDPSTAHNWVNKICNVGSPQDFHTYAVDWTPKAMTFSYDGNVCMTVDWQPAAPLKKPAPFDEPYFMLLNVQFADPTAPAAPVGTMKVDWVKAYK